MGSSSEVCKWVCTYMQLCMSVCVICVHIYERVCTCVSVCKPTASSTPESGLYHSITFDEHILNLSQFSHMKGIIFI